MRFPFVRWGVRSALGVALLLPFLTGCHAYTGHVKTELVKEERVDEAVVRDDLAVEVLNAPSARRPYLKVKVDWEFRKEYRIQKTWRVLREYYPYEGQREVLEVLSSPFLLLLSLPAGLVMAPFEFLYREASAGSKEEGASGGDEAGADPYLFWQMVKLPFLCLNPAGNADEWAAKRNVYGKETAFEDTGAPRVEKGPVQAEAFRKLAPQARVTVILPEANKSFSLRTDGKGTAVFKIPEALARLSMEGKGLTLKLRITFGKKKTVRDIPVDVDTLTEIYESLVMG